MLKTLNFSFREKIIGTMCFTENVWFYFVTWLKIAKQGIYPTKVNEILAVWNDVDGSLSSNVFQKILDGYRVYRHFLNFSFWLLTLQ